MQHILVLFLAVFLFFGRVGEGYAAQTVPPKLFSTGLCSDLVLILLAKEEDRKNFYLSHYSLDASISPYAEEAQYFQSYKGGMETVLLQKPDLVVVDGWTPTQTR